VIQNRRPLFAAITAALATSRGSEVIVCLPPPQLLVRASGRVVGNPYFGIISGLAHRSGGISAIVSGNLRRNRLERSRSRGGRFRVYGRKRRELPA
jgi:hypothetical protein